MKFFGTVILLAILNFCLVFARPNDKQQSNEFFYFWITGGSHKATIVGLVDKTLVDIKVPQYFVVDGERYYVNEIGYNAFAGSKIKSVTIGSDIESISFSAFSFSECSELKTVTINARKVPYVNTMAFFRSNPNVVIKGNSVPAFVKCLGESLVQEWGFTINKDYTNLTQTERKNDLFKLAKKLNQHVTFDGNTDQGNAVVALAIRHASWGGISRAYYQLALIIGIKNTEVLIGGDAAVSAWNYVKVDGKWYNVDVSRFDFKTYPNYTNLFFYTKYGFTNFLNAKQPSGKYNSTPSKWVVVRDLYHYQGESNLNGTYNFDSYLSSNGLGTRA